jgi:hypothetical protein
VIPRNERPALIDVHDRIAEAISHGDMDTAQRLMHDHMQELAARAEQRNPGLMQGLSTGADQISAGWPAATRRNANVSASG